MDARVLAIAEQLLLIERELRLLGYWQAQPPSAQALASEQPFCVDTLVFEQWLQWVFLPRMKALIEAGADLPAASGIAAMASEVFRAKALEVKGLLAALQAFDRLIADGA